MVFRLAKGFAAPIVALVGGVLLQR